METQSRSMYTYMYLYMYIRVSVNLYAFYMYICVYESRASFRRHMLPQSSTWKNQLKRLNLNRAWIQDSRFAGNVLGAGHLILIRQASNMLDLHEATTKINPIKAIEFLIGTRDCIQCLRFATRLLGGIQHLESRPNEQFNRVKRFIRCVLLRTSCGCGEGSGQDNRYPVGERLVGTHSETFSTQEAKDNWEQDLRPFLLRSLNQGRYMGAACLLDLGLTRLGRLL